jgi:UDP-N-acetylglucosamine acyltransferase
MAIHPTALVHPEAELDPTVEIGPYVVIDGPVWLGPRTRVLAHAHLVGDSRLGADNVVHPGASIGGEPQHLAYRGAPSGVRIGDRNVFREGCTVHRGWEEGGMTTIGSDAYVMVNAHVGHDVRIGDGAVVANGALLAGHAEIGERVFVSGNCVVHQHVRIGRLAILRGLSRTSRDVPPFAVMDGTHVVRGVNRVGLARAGFPTERIRVLARAFRALFRVRCNLGEAMAVVEGAHGDVPEVRELLAFMRASTRGVAVGPRATDGARED